MNQVFDGWKAVAARLLESVESQQKSPEASGDAAARLNKGQRASLRAISTRIQDNGVIIADEVGMGKTRIAVELTRAVVQCGGRVAILVPPGLGYQWHGELRDGQAASPTILRSLHGYLEAWTAGRPDPWFQHSIVTISHAFTNWRLGANAAKWRWALLPEIYARWHRESHFRFPFGYHLFANSHPDARISVAADQIAQAVRNVGPAHGFRNYLDQLLRDVDWNAARRGEDYGKGDSLRKWLERVVGMGLGSFDLIVIDEAHKARGFESGLSRLLENVLVPTDSTRRLAMTATPVELNVNQWRSTLGRICVDEAKIGDIDNVIQQYADAVNRVRQCWRSSREARESYSVVAGRFKEALSPYVLRRDKREDASVQLFQSLSGLGVHGYRREQEIAVEPADLSPAWRQSICASEALSISSSYETDLAAKRLRLTMGSGYGLANILDGMLFECSDDTTQLQECLEAQEVEDLSEATERVNADSSQMKSKRQQRATWWRSVLASGLPREGGVLFDHPGIIAAVKAIEIETALGEKVLVFGRFTRPLRALVQLLNARELLRRIESQCYWPQSKVHGEVGAGVDSEWPAIRAAHRQMESVFNIDDIDRVLKARYQAEQRRRERFREHLLNSLQQGLEEVGDQERKAYSSICTAFKTSVAASGTSTDEDRHPLSLVTRALTELLGADSNEVASPVQIANAFCRLIDAASDRDESTESPEIDQGKASEIWQAIETQLHEEYNQPQGTFARLMFGQTRPASRRMLQLAFNRPHSFPRVLVAQSMVGREGLNLHEACRIVILLHPEWNPGVVEQQIGRVDRVGSHWSKMLQTFESGAPLELLPRIEIKPVIFRGTYDEYNWQVLKERWKDLRAQLHGVIVDESATDSIDSEGATLIEEVARHAPNFSPEL